jgi:hypothetical protein
MKLNWPEAYEYDMAVATNDWTEYEEQYGSPDDYE